MAISNQDLIKFAYAWAQKEVDTYGTRPPFFLPFEKGQVLAKQLNANADVVSLGALLMDIKLLEALHLKKAPEHIKMGVAASRDFLRSYGAEPKLIDAVIHCIEAHHGTIPYQSIEAEICANADCYKFLTTKNWLNFFAATNDEEPGYAEQKFNEKVGVLSLQLCKEELAPHISAIKKIVALSKK